jgi:hypothetical protein
MKASIISQSNPKPRPSIGSPETGWSSGSRTAAIRPAVPKTMLTKNTGRQCNPARSALMMNPPTTGPSTGPKAPKARGSCSREKLAMRMRMPCGISSAPNAPCMSRPATIMAGSTARPHIRDAVTNPAMPIR